ncbi:MAG: hypothetical protein WCV80_00295 [Candidatus Paceibacterota bacterium]|jgi:hypothetical protein
MRHLFVLLSALVARLKPEFIHEPEEEVQPGDKVLGELTEWEKNLLGVRYMLDDEVKQKATEHLKEIDHDHPAFKKGKKCEVFLAEAHALEVQEAFVGKVFWMSVNLRFGYPEGKIAIRKGWKAVVQKKDLGDVLEEMFRHR